MRNAVQSWGHAVTVAPGRTRSFVSPILIIAISHCTENLPSIREEDHKKKREVPFLFDFATMARAHLLLDVIYTMSFIKDLTRIR